VDYALHILILILTYALLAKSLDLLLGTTGLLSLAHGALVGVGAYAGGILALRCGFGFAACMVSAVLVVAGIALYFACLAARLDTQAFALATFCLQVVVIDVVRNWESMTRGPLGMPSIPRPSVLGFEVSGTPRFVVLVGAIACGLMWALHCMVRAPWGRLLQGLREDGVLTRVHGKSVAAGRTVAFTVSAGIAGVVGVLHAYYNTFIEPNDFSTMESILVISMVLLGGAGSLWGPVLGAVVLVTLPEALRFVGLPSGIAANMRQILYGAALVACMLWRPQGLIGEYDFGREGKRRGA
jgi:branched-chain amino acid transport system permease protein